ncbi:MAG: TraB/GumN family protein [Thermodesulfobacteriota bacterium]|jgi:uncharacterized protein YbaP (TraB family)
MKNKTSKLLVIFSVLILVSLVASSQDVFSQSQKNFLWRVGSGTNTVYLMGSLHFFRKEIYPLNKRIETAFDQANILVVEANVNDITKIDIQKLVDSALYLDLETLEKHVSTETYELIKKESGRLGLPLEMINRQKPWFLALVLESLELLKLGFDPNYGIDKYFLSKAEGKKKILELESLDYQISLLSNLSDKDQELFLLYTLRDLNILEQELGRLTQAWISGDTKSMESILTRGISEDKGLSSIFEKLIYERNKKMVSKIEDFLRTKEIYFVIVGAGHLVGDRGIIEILKGKGYIVEQL